MNILRVLKNRILLRLGFIMVNRHGFTVYLKDGKQVCSNPRRKYYSMDDKGWCTLDEYLKRNYLESSMYNTYLEDFVVEYLQSKTEADILHILKRTLEEF